MPDEATAVADPEQQTQTDVAGTTETAAGREPETQVAPETPAGQSESGAVEGTPNTASFFEGMSAEEFDRWLKTAPEELRQSSAVLKEIDGRAEQRGRTTTEEALRQQQTQSDLYDGLIAIGESARTWLADADAYVRDRREALRKAVTEEDYEKAGTIQGEIDSVLDSEDFASATDAVAKASELKTARQHTQALRSALGKYTPLIGEMTDQEAALFDEARAHDARNGTAMAQGLLFDLIVGKAVLKGRELERAEIDKDSAADEKLMQRIDGWKKAQGAITPAPAGVGAGDASKEARLARLATGGATDDDRAWLQREYPG